MNDSALDDKPDFEPELKKPRRNYHPWRRLFARLIDYQISGLIFTGLIFSTRLAPDFIVNPLQIQNSFQVASSWAMGFFSIALWVVLEPLILSKFNNTPGKALLRLKLVPNDEHSSYWKRSFSVWAVGLAFGIPLIETFASIIAAIRLKKLGLTDWDRWYGFRVVADEFGFKRGLVAFVLVALVFASNVVLMSDLAWLGAKNTTQVEQSIQSTKENVTPKWEELNSVSPEVNAKSNFVNEKSDEEMNFLLNTGLDTANLPIAQRFPNLILNGKGNWGRYGGAILRGKILPNQLETKTQMEWREKFLELMGKQEVTYQEQIEYCLRWVEAEPQDAKGWEILGRLCNFSKNEAIDAFKSSLRINARNDMTWYYLGTTYDDYWEQYNEAIVAYKQVLRLNPEHMDAWQLLGQDYERTNQLTKAIDVYQQIVRINPQSTRLEMAPIV